MNEFLRENYQAASEPDKHLTRYEQDVAAERALNFVYLGLQSDRQRGRRTGGAWETVEEKLKQKLLAIQMEELDILVKKGDWDPAFALTKRMHDAFAAPTEQDQIAKPLAGVIFAVLSHPADDKQKAEARQRLRQMDELFPENKDLDKSAEVLREQARGLIAKAKKELEAEGPKNVEHIGKLLNEAADVAPDEPDLRDLQSKLTNERPTLRVGVRELPSLMSPVLAASDSDKRAVELMFESLVKLHSDGDGGCRWEPGLADGPPRMITLGRQFQLASDGRWSNGERITADDVRETVKLLKEGKIASRPPVWGDLVGQVMVSESSRASLTLMQGWLDPLALMNFKIVPSGLAPESRAALPPSLWGAGRTNSFGKRRMKRTRTKAGNAKSLSPTPTSAAGPARPACRALTRSVLSFMTTPSKR